MLFQDIIESAEDNPATAGSDLGTLIGHATRFVLDENATIAMARLALLRPSNIMEARAFLRPPALPMWIEYLDPARKAVWAEEGMSVDPDAHHPWRNGLLLLPGLTDDEVLISSFWNFKDADPSGMGMRFHTTPFAMLFNLALDGRMLTRLEHYRQLNDLAPYSHAYRFRDDPREVEALNRIRAHGCAVSSPLIQFSEALIESSPPSLVASWASDIGQEMVFLLCALLMLNSKNLAERRPVEFEKLNRKRGKMGRPPLRDYTEIRLRMPKGAMGVGTRDGAACMAHWYRGHYKIRKTGVFWWRSHMRGAGGLVGEGPSGGKTYRVKG
jgi:hypothetical protein